MRKIIIIILCCAFLSCFKEPKKEQIKDSTISNSLTIKSSENIKDSVKAVIKDSVQNKKTQKTHFEKTIEDINSVFKNNSVSGNSTFILIEKSRNLIRWDNYKFSLNDVNASYIIENDIGYGVNYINIKCYDGNCIEDNRTLENVIGISQAFKTKEDCLKFISLINELKKDLE